MYIQEISGVNKQFYRLTVLCRHKQLSFIDGNHFAEGENIAKC